MRDAFEALAAEDPAAVAYHHRDPTALAAAIVAARTRPATVTRPFRAAVAATAAASGLVTAGLIALLAAGPTLPLIAFAAPRAPVLYSSANAAAPPTHGLAAAARAVTGSLGPGPSLATAYQVALPGTSLTAVERLAGDLGVVGSIGGYNGRVFSETAPSGARVVYDTSSGLASWHYQAGPAPGVSPAALGEAIAKQGWGYRADVPSRGGTVRVVVEGSVTTLRLTVSVRDGHVVDATGPAFVVAASVDYPLRSPAEALTGLSSSTPTRATSSTLTWSAYTLSDSTVWLLPTFFYRGRSGHRPWTASALAVKTRALAGRAG